MDSEHLKGSEDLNSLLVELMSKLETADASKLLKDVEKEEAKRSIPPIKKSCRQYKEANVVRTCLHCNVSSNTTVRLTKSESKLFVDEEGNPFEVKYEDLDKKVCIYTYTSYCEDCETIVRTWDEKEIRRRYLDVMRRIGFLLYRDRKEYNAIVKTSILVVDPVNNRWEDEDLVPNACFSCIMFDVDKLTCRSLEECSKIEG